MLWSETRFEEGAYEMIDEAARAALRSLAAQPDTDEAELRKRAYETVAAQLGDSPLAQTALGEVNWDAVVDEICEIVTISIPSPCCAAFIAVRTKGGLIARVDGSNFAVETFEHECDKCRRRYEVSVSTSTKGEKQTAREFAFTLLPEETLTYEHTEWRSNGARSAHYFWRPRQDGTPVLGRGRRDDDIPF